MKNPLKILLLLGIVFSGVVIALPWNPRNSAASPLTANGTPTPNPRPRAGSAGFTVYLPFIAKPPGPIYLPMIARPAPPTPTPTPTPIPSNPVQNGDFEQGGTAWYAGLAIPYDGTVQGVDLTASRNQLPSPVYPHSGNRVAWMGGFSNSTTTLQTADPNTFTIPPGGKLHYWLWIQSDEPTCSIDYDYAWVYLGTNQAWNQVDAYNLCTNNATNGWVEHIIDVSTFAGQPRWLWFDVRILGENSNLFIDDVSIQ